MLLNKKKGLWQSKKRSTGMKKSTGRNSQSSTVIAKGTSIEGGTIKGNTDVCVDGYFVGDITIEGNLTIGSSGAVYGDIEAQSATISGNCKGKIFTVENVHLTATAVVEGILESRTIIIDDNAVFNGVCKMESHIQLPSKDTVSNFE